MMKSKNIYINCNKILLSYINFPKVELFILFINCKSPNNGAIKAQIASKT